MAAGSDSKGGTYEFTVKPSDLDEAGIYYFMVSKFRFSMVSYVLLIITYCGFFSLKNIKIIKIIVSIFIFALHNCCKVLRITCSHS